MAIYILGGSNTALRGSWADPFTVAMARKYAVHNLSLGATNTVEAFIRLIDEVDLKEGDTVIWSNATNDAICMNHGYFQDFSLIGYTEEIIRRCLDAKARFIPLLLDTFNRVIHRARPDYRDALRELLDHYGLAWIDLHEMYQEETGRPSIPFSMYRDIIHLHPDIEINAAVAERVLQAVERGDGVPHAAEPLMANPQQSYSVFRDFGPTENRQPFDNKFLSIGTWLPPIETAPASEALVEIDTLVLLADPVGGAFDLSVGGARLSFSATHVFKPRPKPIILTVTPRNAMPEGVFWRKGEVLRLDWCRDPANLYHEMYFQHDLGPGDLMPSGARLAGVLLRHHGVV